MRKWIIICGLVFLGILLVYGVLGQAVNIDKYETINRPARISPDYSSTVIPPNIAPLNFMIKEEGAYYYARIYSEKGEAIEVSSKSAKIQIPEDNWHELLEKNRGNELHIDIFVKAKNQGWSRFGTITNRIANEDIDGYLVYRRMHPTHVLMRGRLGIFQRNLGNFDEKVVLDNRRSRSTTGCVNCHTFCKNRPDKVLIGVRTREKGDCTLLIEQQAVNKLKAKFGYTSWHPSGKLAVYSINNLPMVFHTARDEVRDTVEIDSALAYFIVDSKTIRTSPQISKKNILETWPAWSADGRYLYFCSTAIWWLDQTKPLPKEYDKVKYDLVRISYDLENDKWGEVEPVLSAKEAGHSIAMPRTSPDGRWLLFCMCDYGYFPPWQKNSDLYLMDLKAAEQTGRYEYRRLEINSDQSEGWHSWSSNSRWIVFSSKRDFGPFTKTYISYVDEDGKAYKPIVAPQKDPEFYDYCLEAFNTPELATGPIAVNEEQLARVVYDSAGVSMEAPITMATPKAEKNPDWQEVQ
jgi:hypothetical protein